MGLVVFLPCRLYGNVPLRSAFENNTVLMEAVFQAGGRVPVSRGEDNPVTFL